MCGHRGRYAIVEAEVEAPDGQRLTWAYISGKVLVAVLPIDSKGNAYITQDWRLNRDDFVWEAISDWVEESSPTEEQIIAIVERKLRERVGVEAGNLRKLITIYPTNQTSSHFHLFLATNVVPRKDENRSQDATSVKVIPFAEAYDLIMNKQIPTGPNAIMFLMAKEALGL
jgi:hypothetical protein